MFSRKEKGSSKKSSPSRAENGDSLLKNTKADAESALKVCPVCHSYCDPSAEVCKGCGSKLSGGSAWR